MLRHPLKRFVVLVASIALGSGLTVACGSEPEAAPPVTSSSVTSSSSPVTVTPTSSRPSPKPTTSTPPPPPPAAPVNPLTGGAHSPNPVVAVKVDNAFTGAAQFGVSAADVVFVQQVEGGLSRLVAVYHSNLDVVVGPVRSVRSTDAELLPVFGSPALAFSGGAGGPMAALASSTAVDASGWPGYFRTGAVRAPYNLQVRLGELVLGGAIAAPKPIGFTFAATDDRLASAPAVSQVAVQMPSARNGFVFQHGVWQRFRDGNPVNDYDGTPQVADNVVVQWVQAVPDGTVDSAGSPSYLSHTVGGGEVVLYRDGVALSGTWSRPSADAPFAYVDAAGQPLPFKPGKTWVILATPASTLIAS